MAWQFQRQSSKCSGCFILNSESCFCLEYILTHTLEWILRRFCATNYRSIDRSLSGFTSVISPTADVHLDLLQAHRDVMRLHAQVCLASAVVDYKPLNTTGSRFQENQVSDIFASSLSVFGQSAQEFRRPAAAVVCAQ